MQFESDGQVHDDAQASDEAPEIAPEAAEEAATEDFGPSVDELEERLRDLQGAMDKIQSGDLDAAERAIESLEQGMETARD